MARPSNVATQWSEPDGGSADGSSTYHWLATRIASPDGDVVTLGAIRMLGRPAAPAGSAIGRAVDRGLAAKTVAEAPQGATIIPLDMVASLQTFRPTRLGSLFSGETLVVTTADGTEYGFRGRAGLQNDIAGALAGLGREVRATTTGLAVNPRTLNGEG